MPLPSLMPRIDLCLSEVCAGAKLCANRSFDTDHTVMVIANLYSAIQEETVRG